MAVRRRNPASHSSTMTCLRSSSKAWTTSLRTASSGCTAPPTVKRSACVRYGVITGLSCVTTCWALMAAVAAFSHSVLVMAVVFGVQISDRYQRRPSPLLTSLAIIGVCLLSF